MDYINTVFNFLHAYSIVILPLALAIIFLFGLANWLSNPYRKQNKKLNVCYKGVCSHPDSVSKYADKLPEEYRRQWRVVVNCGAKPSLAFEFVPKRKRSHLLWLFVIAAVLCATYVAVYFVTARYFSYLIFQVVFWFAFGLVLVANRAVKISQERRARKVLAKLVSQLNKCAPYSCDIVEDTVKQLQQLNRHEVNDTIVGKASELLRNKGLESNRSVEEQRRLNSALNGLLQAYARNARRLGNSAKNGFASL
ncbi:MAG: hypothetical protein J1F68_02215 [Clostridiales bacterium]|nr:hypothetical protein [Clostridiales bacterium]